MTSATYLIPAPDVIILSQQRSGTHLLQSALARHPQIETRGEFLVHYQRALARGVPHPEMEAYPECPYRYRRRENFVNIGIVMYSHIALYEELCAPLESSKIIHLLRDPSDVAQSLAQMDYDKKTMGAAFRAHYHASDVVNLPRITTSNIEEKAAQIALAQDKYKRRLSNVENVLTVTYEELTGNVQVNELAYSATCRLMEFLNLQVVPLKTELVKTSLRGTGSNALSVLAPGVEA